MGGTGKTPLTIWLIEKLQQHGYRPGVVSRGYGGKVTGLPHLLSAGDDVQSVGDEPLMIFRRTGVPVVIDPDRSAATKRLIAAGEVDVIISDDGLQHYGLARTMELAVVDGRRGFGNGGLLPMGPLREPVTRLQTVDAVVVNGEPTEQLKVSLPMKTYPMTLQPGALQPLGYDSESVSSVSSITQPLAAVAGIGNPQRFFATLDQLGLRYIPVPYPDHHQYTDQDLQHIRGVADLIVTTEKDAVKLQQLPGAKGVWLPVNAELGNELIDVILSRLNAFRQDRQHRY